jgi:hypothetical protein
MSTMLRLDTMGGLSYIEVLRPPDIEGRAVWPYPVLLRAPPVGLPETISLFGIVDIHDVHPKNSFNVYRLGKNSTYR